MVAWGRLPWRLGTLLLFVLAASLTTFICETVVIVPGGHPDPFGVLLELLTPLPPVALGALILLRTGGNRIGWLLLGSGVGIATLVTISVVSTRLALVIIGAHGADSAGALVAVSLIASGLYPIVYVAPTAIALVFPWGTPPNGRVRIALILMATVSLFVFVGFVISPTGESPLQDQINPLSIPALTAIEDVLGAIFGLAWFGLLLSLVYAAIVMGMLAAASTGELRLQRLWLGLGVALVPITLITCGLGTSLGVIPQQIGNVGILLMELALVGSITAAILRHRLYGIQRLVNRALVYAVLTAVLIMLFVLFSSALGVILGQGSTWTTALATAVAAASFVPVRRVIQRRVDERFASRRVAAVNQVRLFTSHLHQGKSTASGITGVLAQALEDADLRVCEQPDIALSSTERIETPVNYAGSIVAWVDHRADLAFDADLLRAVLTEAAPTLAMLRLQREVHDQLQEVQQSRTRIVRAGYEERRRLERDLHDGAQQRLVVLGITLRRIQGSLPPAAQVLSETLGGAVDQVRDAIVDLRTIASGVRPPRLDDGLRAALTDLATTSPIAVDVDVPAERMTSHVEEAAYFITCEAITNAIKHSSANRVTVRATVGPAELRIIVSDDGTGGANNSEGGGVAGMMDRARANGGDLRLVSPAGEGTRIELSLPLSTAA